VGCSLLGMLISQRFKQKFFELFLKYSRVDIFVMRRVTICENSHQTVTLFQEMFIVPYIFNDEDPCYATDPPPQSNKEAKGQ